MYAFDLEDAPSLEEAIERVYGEPYEEAERAWQAEEPLAKLRPT